MRRNLEQARGDQRPLPGRRGHRLRLGGLNDAAHDRARSNDRILAGSSWNRDYARAAGIDKIEFISQGVDTKLFYPEAGPGA